MKLSQAIKPVSYFKANMAEILNKLRTGESGPMIITQNGEASGVIMSMHDYERVRESLAMLKLVALGEEEIAEGRHRPMREAMENIRNKRGYAK